MEDVRQKVESVEGVTAATVNLVFEPEWDKDMMTEEAKLELGFCKKRLMDAMKNVYFLSDAHLGSRAIAHGRTQERRLVNFWTVSSIGQRPSTCWATCSISGMSSSWWFPKAIPAFWENLGAD